MSGAAARKPARSLGSAYGHHPPCCLLPADLSTHTSSWSRAARCCDTWPRDTWRVYTVVCLAPQFTPRPLHHHLIICISGGERTEARHGLQVTDNGSILHPDTVCPHLNTVNTVISKQPSLNLLHPFVQDIWNKVILWIEILKHCLQIMIWNKLK